MTRKYQPLTVQELASCTCDRCLRRLTPDEPGEWQERLSIDHSCGFESVFGNRNTVSLDLCQHCVREVLGQWLRIAQPECAQELNAMAERVAASAKEASTAPDDALSPVAASDQRIGTMAEALARMPNVGEDTDFARHPRLGKFAAFGADFMAEGRSGYEHSGRAKAVRRLGRLKGRVRVQHNFDAPLSLSLVSKKKSKKQP